MAPVKRCLLPGAVLLLFPQEALKQALVVSDAEDAAADGLLQKD